MEKTDDDFRQYLDELENMIDNEKRWFRELKEIPKHLLTFKNIGEMLRNRRQAYDHAFVECLTRNGINKGNIRSLLDNLWDKCRCDDEKSEKEIPWYTKIFGFPEYHIFRLIIKRWNWSDYLDSTNELAVSVWKE